MKGEITMKHELAFRNHEKGLEVARALLDEDYVVLLSYEDDLLILNYEYAQNSDRNYVVFQSRDEYEEELDTIYADARKDFEKNEKF